MESLEIIMKEKIIEQFREKTYLKTDIFVYISGKNVVTVKIGFTEYNIRIGIQCACEQFDSKLIVKKALEELYKIFQNESIKKLKER